MRRYYCLDLEGGRAGNRQSADFVFRLAPPLMEFTLYNWAARQSWMPVNTNWNPQSLGSLESLRPPDAWVMNSGIARTGKFRAVYPTTPTPMLPITISLTCEISWGSAFINITGQVSGEWLLFSMRPPQGRNWVQLDTRPPRVEYLMPCRRGLSTITESGPQLR